MNAVFRSSNYTKYFGNYSIEFHIHIRIIMFLICVYLIIFKLLNYI